MSRVVSTWCLFLDNGDELSVQGVRTAKSVFERERQKTSEQGPLCILPTMLHVLGTFSFENF